MMLVDDQSGSKDLFPLIRSLTSEVILTRIDPPFGDIVWDGNGPDDKLIRVAVEYKKIREVLDHAFAGTGRFTAHQVGGLVEHYDRRYLLVEMGKVRIDRNTGILQDRRGKDWVDIVRGGKGLLFRDLEHWFTTIEEQAQFRVKLTYDEYESSRWVVAKYTWWTGKKWDDHDALKQFYVPPPPTVSFQRPSLLRRWLKELDDIRWERSLAAEQHFDSALSMAAADEKEWMKIAGIGKTIAANAVREIRRRLR